MRLLFDEAPVEGKEYACPLEPLTVSEAAPEIRLDTPLSGFCFVRRENMHTVLVDIRLQGQYHSFCDRCLQPFSTTIASESRLALRRVGVNSPISSEECVQSEALDLIEVDGPFIDLDALVREQFLLNLPMKKLCQEACAGICLHCGASLHDGVCACQQAPSNSPFAVLATLTRNP